ncbi:MAG: hypothetical protein ACRDY0_07585 [Acidimicrobiales bacterium]
MGGTSGTPGHVTITPLYWAPTGYSFPASYKPIINTYLADVAAASNTTDNVFGVAQQYYQQLNGGPSQFIDYQVTAGAEVDTNDTYPAQGGANGCTADAGFTACVADSALQAEVGSTVAAHALTVDDSHLYMVFFPPGVETCQGPGRTATGDICSTNVYCGYHAAFGTLASPYLYANMPYPILNGCSDVFNGPQAPNGDPYAADAVSVTSHEASEAITDWDGAWIDASGNENGDECAYVYGVPQGTTTADIAGTGATGTMYNQVINGHFYYTQDEFSNADFALGQGDPNFVGAGQSKVDGCIQRPDKAHAAFSYPTDGATNVESTQPFTWNAAAAAQGYYVTVGTTVGGYDLVNSGTLASSQTSLDVGALPTGQTLHARVYTRDDGNYDQYRGASFAVATGGEAVFTYPTDGATNVESTQPFTWNAAAAAQGYYVTVGTTVGGYDLVNSGTLASSQTSLDVGALPTGQTLHARVYTEENGTFQRYQDISFTTDATRAEGLFTNPTAGETGVTAAAPFTWSAAGAGTQGYYLTVGTTVGGFDVANTGTLGVNVTSYQVEALPPGKTLHARIYTKADGDYQRYQDITFTTAP